MNRGEDIQKRLLEMLEGAEAIPHVEESPRAWHFVYKKERGMIKVGFLRPWIEEHLAEEMGLNVRQVLRAASLLEDIELDKLHKNGVSGSQYLWLRLRGEEKKLLQ